MRKLALIAGWFVLLPLPLAAQVTDQAIPKAELYWGYSLVRTERTNMQGFNVSIAANLNRNLAVVADFSGNYGNSEERFTSLGLPTEADFSTHTFVVGPRVSEKVDGNWNLFAHALVGVTRLTVDADFRLGSGSIIFADDAEVAFAGFFGGGLDYIVSNGIAVRLIQADYLVFHNDALKNQGARIGAGIVFRWGRKTP